MIDLEHISRKGTGVPVTPCAGSHLPADRAERLKGTNGAEEIRGLGGADEVVDDRGKDVAYGGSGVDNLIGYGDASVDRFSGGGNDTVRYRDVPAVKDAVYADEADTVSGDCERVKLR